jgi:Ferritin-like domain
MHGDAYRSDRINRSPCEHSQSHLLRGRPPPVRPPCSRRPTKNTEILDAMDLCLRRSSNARTDLAPDTLAEVTKPLNTLLADMFALYVKTKNFHWHVTGPHFRDYHRLLDEQATPIFATTDASLNACESLESRPYALSGASSAHRRQSGPKLNSVRMAGPATAGTKVSKPSARQRSGHKA